MIKFLKNTVLFSAMLILLTGCYLKNHQPGQAAAFIPNQKLNRPRSLADKKMYIEVATAKGIFKQRKRNNYRYSFLPNGQYDLRQMANLEFIAKGNYRYRISRHYAREGLLALTNSTSKDRFAMRLNFYNDHMGIYTLWRVGHRAQDIQTGIFKIVPETFKLQEGSYAII